MKMKFGTTMSRVFSDTSQKDSFERSNSNNTKGWERLDLESKGVAGTQRGDKMAETDKFILFIRLDLP